MIEEFRVMLEVSSLLSRWSALIAFVICVGMWLYRVDSLNDLTVRPIPGAPSDIHHAA